MIKCCGSLLAIFVLVSTIGETSAACDSIKNCTRCANPAKCDECKVFYTLSANGMSCDYSPCSMPACLRCVPGNTKNCTECQPGYGFPSATDHSRCVSCSSKDGCAKCTTLNQCTLCRYTYLAPKTDGSGTCGPACVLENCSKCLPGGATATSARCLECRPGYGTPSSTDTGSCKPCNTAAGCAKCTNIKQCTLCQSTSLKPLTDGSGGCTAASG